MMVGFTGIVWAFGVWAFGPCLTLDSDPLLHFVISLYGFCQST